MQATSPAQRSGMTPDLQRRQAASDPTRTARRQNEPTSISTTLPWRMVKIVPRASGIGPAWRLHSALLHAAHIERTQLLSGRPDSNAGAGVVAAPPRFQVLDAVVQTIVEPVVDE